MKEITGNVWDYHAQGKWIVITTNGCVKSNGEAVMGRGVALQAKQRFPHVARELGDNLRRLGNVLSWYPTARIIFFPVKHSWWEKANLTLIEISAKSLAQLWNRVDKEYTVYLVRPGCGNGGLDWKDVKPILEKYLDDRFVVVSNG